MKTKIWLLSAVLAFSGLALTSSAGFASPLSGDEDREGEAKAKSSTIVQPALEVVEKKDHSAAASSSKAKGKADAEPEVKQKRIGVDFFDPEHPIEMTLTEARLAGIIGKQGPNAEIQLTPGSLSHINYFALLSNFLDPDSLFHVMQPVNGAQYEPFNEAVFGGPYAGSPKTMNPIHRMLFPNSFTIKKQALKLDGVYVKASSTFTVECKTVDMNRVSGVFANGLTFRAPLPLLKTCPFRRITLLPHDTNYFSSVTAHIDWEEGKLQLEGTNWKMITLELNEHFWMPRMEELLASLEKQAPTGLAGKADAEDSGDEV